MRGRFELTDFEWSVIEPLLPNKPQIMKRGGFANIPAKRNRRQSFAFSAFLCRYRNLIEGFFGKLKHARGLATRYDKRADNFLAAIKLFSARLWINAYESTA